MKCYYHATDLDGECSAAIVKMKRPDCQLIPINYGDLFDIESVEVGEIIYMVDFSLEPFERMIELSHKAYLIWIDHHKTAIREYEANIENMNNLGLYHLHKGRAACELTWMVLFPHKSMPSAVSLLGRYDVWDRDGGLSWKDGILPFQYGMKTVDTSPRSKIWSWLLGGKDQNPQISTGLIISRGKDILKYIKGENQRLCNIAAFPMIFEGHSCIAMNALGGSKLFESVWNSNYFDFMLSFTWFKDKWKVGLYTDKPNVDVSAIAKIHNGGGHEGAAGFMCKRLPYDIRNAMKWNLRPTATKDPEEVIS